MLYIDVFGKRRVVVLAVLTVVHPGTHVPWW
jgi:hypothetical protein